MSPSSPDRIAAPGRAFARRLAAPLAVVGLAAVGLAAVGPGAAAPAASETPDARAAIGRALTAVVVPIVHAADTTSTDTSRRRPRGDVRIRIDEHGVSVQGDIDVDGDDFDDIHVDVGEPGMREKGRDIVRLGEDVTVGEREIVRGDLVVVGGRAVVDGRVTGNVAVIGADLHVGPDGEVRGDAIVIGGTIDESPGAIIRGERVVLHGVDVGRLAWRRGGLRRAFLPVSLAARLLVGLIVVLFLGTRVVRASEHVHGAAPAARCTAIGLFAAIVAVVAVPVAMVLLAITIVGAPLAVLIALGAFAALLVAWSVSAVGVGRAILPGEERRAGVFAAVVIGTLVLAAPQILAWIVDLAGIGSPDSALRLLGRLVSLVAYLAGIGALVSSRFGSRPGPAATR